MTIIQLQTFMTIIELGSFSAAANALGVCSIYRYDPNKAIGGGIKLPLI